MLWPFLLVAHAADLRPAVVFVQQGSSACAGTLIDGTGTVLTAYHCVMSGGRPKLTTQAGDVAIGRVVAVDRRRDLALVETGWRGQPYLPIRETPPVADEPVRVVGHPQGANLPGGFFTGLLRWAVSEGTVSAVGPHALQTTAPINPGNSGGPVVDASGEVVGVVSRRMVGDGLGFAGRVDQLPERRPMGPLGGRVAVGVHVQTDGLLFAVGSSVALEFRDRIIFSGAFAVPLGGRWLALEVGRVTHHPYEGRVALRQRIGRGTLALRVDGWAGVQSVHTLTWDGDDFSRVRELSPAVGGRAQLRGIALDYGMALTNPPSFRARVELGWPGTLFKL